jgi:hypothetical protein
MRSGTLPRAATAIDDVQRLKGELAGCASARRRKEILREMNEARGIKLKERPRPAWSGWPYW